MSAATGEGIPALIDALARLADRLPEPDPGAPLRLWVDQVSCTATGGAAGDRRDVRRDRARRG